MQKVQRVTIDERTVFRSLYKTDLVFVDVYQEIRQFILQDFNCSYRISIGTDSQVDSGTLVASCIHVHRIGKGAIGFLHKAHMNRPLLNLREKIFMETSTSLQLAYLFDDNRISGLRRLLQPTGQRGLCTKDNSANQVFFEIHIDIGNKGETRTLIKEMLGMVRGLEFVPRIKPDSYCASSFADRYTKVI